MALRAPTKLYEPKMTSVRAATSLALAIVFDALKFICSMLFLAAPFLAAAAIKIFLETHGWPTWAAGIIATTAGGSTAALEIVQPEIAGAFTLIGTVLAMAVGFLGWLILILLFLLWGIEPFSSRNLFRVMLGWIASELPLVNLFPTFTPSVWLIVRDAKQKDREATQKQQGNKEAEENQRAQRQLVQTEQARILEGEALEAEYAQMRAESANQNDETPNEVREAA